jgi:hypothetical protein
VIVADSAAHDLSDHGRLLVRRAVHRDDWISEALFDLAAADQSEWTPLQWDTLLADLERCDMTISEFIDFYGE